MLEVENVYKVYDRLVAVDGVSLSLRRGSTLGLIGPNGSGKTTLLRMIATLVKPTAGSLRVGGVDVVRRPREVRKVISMMPAETSAPADMTIGEFMRYFASCVGIPRKRRRQAIDEALELTEMAGRDALSISGLSTGNRQRLLLAKTLLGDPELLLLDEPASGLDPRARIEVRGFLKALAAMGKTIVISSHILADLDDICSDVLIIEQGSVRASGAIDQIRQREEVGRTLEIRVQPAAEQVARQLLGELEGVSRLTAEGGRLRFGYSEDSSNPLLSALIANQIEIVGFKEHAADLEEIFMSSTEGVVS